MPAPAFTALAEFAATRHGVTTRTQAVALGLTPGQITTAKSLGLIHEPMRGVLTFAAHPDTFAHRLAMATARPQPLYVSHGACARVRRLDGFEGVGPEVSVTSVHRVRLDAMPDVRIHHVASLDPCDVEVVNHLPCTSLARTLADLGSGCTDDQLWKALIAARRLYNVNPMWLQQTAIRLHRPGQAGTATLLRALRRWEAEGALPESWLEEVVARLLRHPRIPPIVPQHTIRTPAGSFVARVDFAIPSARLGIEAHGRRFHFGPDRETADEDRDLAAAACGWELLYIGWYAAKRPSALVELIADVAEARLRGQL